MKSFPFPIACLALAFALVAPARAADEARARYHMIAAANPLAAEAGLEMLRAGGSAVDAAIAAQLVLTLVEPQSSGIGGGAFLIVFNEKNSALKSYDGREIAPASATPNMFLDASAKARSHFEMIPGGMSVGVPGTVALLAKAHRAHGRLAWAKLFQPAIKLAEHGFTVSPRLAGLLAAFPQMAVMPDMRDYFFKGAKTPLKAGERLRNRALAQTMREIAEQGPDAFYKGPIADAIVRAVANAPVNPAIMTREDLARYEAKERAPVCGAYRVWRVCSVPPPSSGGVAVLQILGMLEGFEPGQLAPASLSAVHLISEASRLAFADRAMYLGDPDFVSPPVEGLLDRGYLAGRAKRIDPARAMGVAEAGTPPVKRAELIRYAPDRFAALPGTSHLVAVDAHGQAASMTMTIEFAFGSELMANGFLLNNELTDFSFEPARGGKPVANAPGPGKRPLSSMAPTIVFGPDGRFLLGTGSAGGPAIIGYVAQTISGVLDGGLTMQQSIALPHHVNANGATQLERGTALVPLVPALSEMGHDVMLGRLESGLQGIRRIPDGFEGGADPRREGVAVGD